MTRDVRLLLADRLLQSMEGEGGPDFSLAVQGALGFVHAAQICNGWEVPGVPPIEVIEASAERELVSPAERRALGVK